MEPPEILWVIEWSDDRPGTYLSGPYKTDRAAEQAAEDMHLRFRRSTAVYPYGLAPSAPQDDESDPPYTVTAEDVEAAGQRASADKVLLWSVDCFRCRRRHNVSSDDQAYFEGAQQLCPECLEQARGDGVAP